MQKEMLLNLSSIGLGTINNAVIQLGDIDDTGKGKHFTSRFIQAGLVKIEGHGIVLLKKETLDMSLQSMVGAPVIIKHQDVTDRNADELRCGVISKAYFYEPDGWYYCEGIIWDTKAQELINNKDWSVSCSYDFLSYNDEGGIENNIKYDKEFTQLNFTHLALVNNPRYERANIVFNSKDEENGTWVTIKGNHIFIPDGKTLDEVIKEKGWGDKENKQSDKDRIKIADLKSRENEVLKQFYEAKEGSSEREHLQYELDALKDERFRLEDKQNPDNELKKNKTDDGDSEGEYKYNAKQLTYGKQYLPKGYQGPVLTFIGEDNGKAYFREGYDAFNREAKKVSFEEGTKFASHETGSNLGKGVNPLPNYMLSSGSESNRQRIQYIKEHGKPSEYENRDINNSKEQDMTLLEEIKKLITRVENEKGEQDMDEKEKVDNEQVDKRKLIDEVGGMLKNKVDEELWRTIIGKLEKLSYNGSEDSKTDNKKVKNEEDEKDEKEDDVKNKKVKNEEDKKEEKVDNEDEEDEEKVKEVKKEVKEDVDNKCKNSKETSFDKINAIYNSVKQITQESKYVSRQEKLDNAVEYFK